MQEAESSLVCSKHFLMSVQIESILMYFTRIPCLLLKKRQKFVFFCVFNASKTLFKWKQLWYPLCSERLKHEHFVKCFGKLDYIIITIPLFLMGEWREEEDLNLLEIILSGATDSVDTECNTWQCIFYFLLWFSKLLKYQPHSKHLGNATEDILNYLPKVGAFIQILYSQKI